jgi:hypothetical protein
LNSQGISYLSADISPPSLHLRMRVCHVLRSNQSYSVKSAVSNSRGLSGIFTGIRSMKGSLLDNEVGETLQD